MALPEAQEPVRAWLCAEIALDGEGPVDELAGLTVDALTELGCIGAEQCARPGGRGARLLAYFATGTDLTRLGEVLRDELPPGVTLLASSPVEDEGWVERWNASLRPIDVGSRFTILPGAGEPGPGRLALRIEPGRAFGTGHHESTRLALEWLERTVEPGDRVLDVGTGSGILALAAARLGAREVVGVDDDPEAIEVASANARLIPESAAACLTTHSGVPASQGTFDAVVANITSDVLLPMLPELTAAMANGGHLVLSGLLTSDEERIELACASLGLSASWLRAGEWSSARCQRA